MAPRWRVLVGLLMAVLFVQPPVTERSSFNQAPVVIAQAGGGTVELAGVPWRSATTGWMVLADRDTPLRDSSFTYGPMTVAGESFSRGIATYPFSEIVYDVSPLAAAFIARVGITDDAQGVGSVRFSVYGDDLLLYRGDVARAGERARDVAVEVAGFGQLRLVVDDAGDGSLGDYALWGNPRLGLNGDVTASASTLVSQARLDLAAETRVRLAADEAALRERATSERATIAEHFRVGPQTQGGFDQASSTAVLANDRIGIVAGYGGKRNGRLSVFDYTNTVPALVDVAPVLVTENGERIPLTDLQPWAPTASEFRRFQDPSQGAGGELVLRYQRARQPSSSVTFRVAVFDGDPIFRIGVTTSGIRLSSVDYLSSAFGSLTLGDAGHYLTDRSHLYRGDVRRDGNLRRAPFQTTEPALVWSDDDQRGILLAFHDYVPSPAWLSIRAEPGRRGVSLGVQLAAELNDFGPDASSPPPLTVELIKGPVGTDTFRRYREAMSQRYPSKPLPSAARYQWGSWYTYGPGVSAANFTHQLDLVARRFGDLGPWHMLLDAGWYVQYGREGAELANVDTDKFPNGIGAVADAVHAAGMELILYLGTGFVHDSGADGGEWLALTALIENHPDWMIPFQTAPSAVRRYLLDYAKPEVQEYLTGIIRDFFLVHRVDGILLDGIADAEGQLIPRVERDAAGGPPHPLLPTLDIYRLISETAATHNPGAYVSSGWLTPQAANPFVTTYFYGDDSELIDSPYPFPGFLQKLDYALFSRIAMNQRAYIGASIGETRRPDALWWVQAAAALGTPAAISFNVAELDRRTLAFFRADLRAVDPATGTTAYGPGLFPDYFATTRDGVTHLGVVNRENTTRGMVVSLRTLGLTAPAYTVLDVTSGEGSVVENELTVVLPDRSFRYYVLRPTPGLLRTASVTGDEIADAEAGLISFTVSGSVEAPGFAQIVAPPSAIVLVDGVPAIRAPVAPLALTGSAPINDLTSRYTHDERSGLLTISYAHSGRRSIQVRW